MHKKQILWLSLAWATMTLMTPTKTVLANQSDSSGSQTSSPNVSIDPINGNGIPNVVTIDLDSGTITGTGIDVPITFGSSSGGGSGTSSGLGIGSSSGTGSALGATKPGESIPGGASGTADSQTPNSAEDSGSGNSLASEPGECSTIACLEATGESQDLTINDVAELLENNLDDSLDTLTAIESEKLQNSGVARTNKPQEDSPRRIVRNNNTRRNVSGAEPRRIARQNSPHGCGQSCASPDIPTVEALQVQPQEREVIEVIEKKLVETQKFIEQVNRIDPEKNIW